MIRTIKGFDYFLEVMSRWGLITNFISIIFLAVLSIFLRWVGKTPLWIEPLIRHLVFLCAFLGGSLATSKGVHIKIDLVNHLIERSNYKILNLLHKNLVDVFCLVTMLFLTQASWDFFQMEKEFGSPAFLDIHSSYLVFIVPFGLGLITLRYFNRLIINIIHGDNIGSNRL